MTRMKSRELSVHMNTLKSRACNRAMSSSIGWYVSIG